MLFITRPRDYDTSDHPDFGITIREVKGLGPLSRAAGIWKRTGARPRTSSI